MTYFIAHPSACRLYAQCHGWQETLAHFFVKVRRENAPQSLLTTVSPDDIVFKQSNDQGFYSREDSSDRLHTDDSSTPATPISLNETDGTPTLTTSIRPEDLSSLLELDNPADQSDAVKTQDGRPPYFPCQALWTILGETYARPALHLKRTSLSAVAVAAAVADDKNAETLEEICETLILAIVMIMWKGITDFDEAAWMVR